MSKKSRTFQPPTSSGTTPAAPDAATTPLPGEGASTTTPAPAPTTGSTTPRPPTAAVPTTSASATSRSAARRKAANAGRVSAPPSFFERYRVFILGAIAILVIGGTIGIVANMSSTSATAYTCESLLTPGPTDPIPTPRPATPAPSVDPAASPAPTTSPEPQPTQRLGFTTQDLGKNHVTTSDKVDYDYCPPASGPHYNLGGGVAPLARQFYPPDTRLGPGNWIHNLEHGYVVLLYKGEPSEDVQQQLQDIMEEANAVERCGYPMVIAVRSDDMDLDVNFAAVAWDRELLLKDFDKELLLTFANQWQDSPQNPEPGLC